MSRIPKTVFISYRRTNQAHAIKLYQLLEEAGYDPFLDIKNLGSGAWRVIIQREIQKRAHFILLLTPSAVERLTDPQDVLRFEIETALDNKRNLVPLMFEGFSYSDPRINAYLTGKLAILSEYNAFPINWRRLKKDIQELTTRFMSVHPDDVVHPQPLTNDDEFADGVDLDDMLVIPEPKLAEAEESLDMDDEVVVAREKSAPKPPIQPTTSPRQRDEQKERTVEGQKKSSGGLFGWVGDILNPQRGSGIPADTPPSEEGTFSPPSPTPSPPPQSKPAPRPSQSPAPIMPLPSVPPQSGVGWQTQSGNDMSEAELLFMMRDALSQLPPVTDDDLAAEEAEEIS